MPKKNQTDKLIIIYHSDERNGTPIAQKLAEKGFENVFLLSGGIEKFMEEFPEQLEGKKLPVIKKPQDETKSNFSLAKSQVSQVSETANAKKQQVPGVALKKTQDAETRKSQVSVSVVQKSCASLQKAASSKVNTPSQKGDYNMTPNSKINKRSNYKEYPKTGNVLITKDFKGEKEIQNIMNNSPLNQNSLQMSPTFVNDSVFSNNFSVFKQ